MEEQKRSVTIEVAGHQLHLKTVSSAERIQEITKLVDAKLKELAPRIDVINHQVLLLLALNFADELLQMRDENQKFKDDIRHKSQFLLSQIEQEFSV